MSIPGRRVASTSAPWMRVGAGSHTPPPPTLLRLACDRLRHLARLHIDIYLSIKYGPWTRRLDEKHPFPCDNRWTSRHLHYRPRRPTTFRTSVAFRTSTALRSSVAFRASIALQPRYSSSGYTTPQSRRNRVIVSITSEVKSISFSFDSSPATARSRSAIS